LRIRFDHAGYEHQKAWRTEAALKAMMIDERLLKWMQSVTLGQTFNGPNIFVRRLYREHKTGANGLAIHYDGAGAANAMFAADVCASKPAIFSQSVGKRTAWLQSDLMLLAIDFQRYVQDGHLPGPYTLNFLPAAAKVPWRNY
jgi:hypothetical protein